MVVEVTENEVVVEWMLGSYASVWTPWKPKDGSNLERAHRNAVIMSGIELTKSRRLKTDDIRALKLIYSNVELMWLPVSTCNDKNMFTELVPKWKIEFSMLLTYIEFTMPLTYTKGKVSFIILFKNQYLDK